MGYPHPASRNIVGALVRIPLWLPGKEPRFMPYTILGGQTLAPGSVLGRVTATGKLKLCVAAAGDGSQTAMAVLQEPLATFAADGTTALDMVMAVAVEGSVNRAALVLGAGMVLSDVVEQLRVAGFISRVPGYSG